MAGQHDRQGTSVQFVASIAVGPTGNPKSKASNAIWASVCRQRVTMWLVLAKPTDSSVCWNPDFIQGCGWPTTALDAISALAPQQELSRGRPLSIGSFGRRGRKALIRCDLMP